MIRTPIGYHTFRVCGITAYLQHGGMLEKATMSANHASTRTTQLYDASAWTRRYDDQASLFLFCPGR